MRAIPNRLAMMLVSSIKPLPAAEHFRIDRRFRRHWLIGGRALERAINESREFLVHALGRELLPPPYREE